MDFRRLGGKKPRVRRERRPISTATGEGSIITQESCFQGRCWGVGLEGVVEGDVAMLDVWIDLRSGRDWTSE